MTPLAVTLRPMDDDHIDIDLGKLIGMVELGASLAAVIHQTALHKTEMQKAGFSEVVAEDAANTLHSVLVTRLVVGNLALGE